MALSHTSSKLQRQSLNVDLTTELKQHLRELSLRSAAPPKRECYMTGAPQSSPYQQSHLSIRGM